MEKTNGRSIDEALTLLDRIAHEKKDELQKLVGEKYSHIRDAFSEVAAKNRHTVGELKKTADQFLHEGKEKVTDAASSLDKKVRKEPWGYIGATGAAALLLGFILGRGHK